MVEKRFEIYNKETSDTYIKDNIGCFNDGTPKNYWFTEHEDFCALFDILTELVDENEELRQILKIYRKIANCRNCDYHNYDWYDDGDEFEVCEKGKDLSNRICEEWRKF